MRIKTKRNVYLVLIVIFITIIITSIYYLLGGFEEVKVYRLEPTVRTVVGKYFAKPGSDSAADHRKLCRDLVESGDISGLLTEVIFLVDTAENQEAGRFVGISLDEDIAEVPREFEIREFESGARFAVFLDMHFLVQPRPPKIEAMLIKRAEEEGFELSNFFFSLVYSDGSRSVEGWARE